MSSTSQGKVAFQGELGAYSQAACAKLAPDLAPQPCATFEDVFALAQSGEAACAVLPVENSLAGRVADVHHLLPDAGLAITAEYFMPIRHQLLAPRGSSLGTLKRVRSHPMALGQCRLEMRRLGLQMVSASDTAGAAREIAELNDPTEGALASALAGQIYGLAVVKADIADAAHNTTRFLRLEKSLASPDFMQPALTSIVFTVRNVPAALYKALGGLATNSVNILRIESHQSHGFRVARFFVDIDGRPEARNVALALDELRFFSSEFNILGVYPADPYRVGELRG